MIWKLISESIEVKGWGWNALTVSFIATIFFALLQGWGIWKQTAAIWKSRSGESVSIPLAIQATFFFAAFFLYGFFTQSLAAIISGSLCFLFAPTLFGLWKFKRDSWIWPLFIVFLLLPLAMATLNQKHEVMLVGMFSTIAVLGLQLIELVRRGTRGSLELWLIIAFGTSSFFWTVYGFATQNWVIRSTSPAFLLLWLIIGLVWWRNYPVRKALRWVVPLKWSLLSGPIRLNQVMAKYVWEAVFDAGYDAMRLVAKTKELGDGRLALGFYWKKSDDFQNPIIGFIIPMGFWWSTDNRMPLNWIHARPPINYGPPDGKVHTDLFLLLPPLS